MKTDTKKKVRTPRKSTVPLKSCISKFKFNLKGMNFKEKMLLEAFLKQA